MGIWSYIWIYLAVINIVTFFAFGFDKHQARKHRWRIPENVLLFLSAIGGSFGGRMAMGVYNHKTKKSKFTIGVTVMLFVHLLGLLAYFTFFTQLF